MEVYFLKKLILYRSDIRGRNESQNIEGCSGAKLQEPLLIPPLAPPKPISFYPSPFLSTHFPPPFSWPKPKSNAATHFPFLSFSFLFFSFLFFPPLAHHFPLSSPMLPTPLIATLPPTISPLSYHFSLSSPMQTPITPLAHHAGSPLKTPPLAIKATKKEKKGVGFI